MTSPDTATLHRHGRHVHDHPHAHPHRHVRRIQRSQPLEAAHHQHRHEHADDHGHSHGLIDPSIVRSREGVKTVSISLAVLALAAGVQLAIFILSDSVALLAGWYYSSWCDGEWIAAPDRQHMPYRRIVNAIARVAKKEAVSI